MRKLKNILVTGGCGFIGSNFIKSILSDNTYDCKIINVDCLTYAANPHYINSYINNFPNRYFFEKTDIRDAKKIESIFAKYDIDTVVHFAAETHVDRSISNPDDFITTNINGTFNLLEAARKYWNCSLDKINTENLFHYISTDEVYGALGNEGYFFEETPLNPKSPYSASKASAQMMVMAYNNTYGVPVTISNCSNNFGPNQNEEKLIPHTIKNIINNQPIPVYGKGTNIRDWIFVDDHNSAVMKILKKGRTGQCYNIGGETELTNIELINKIIQLISKKMNKAEEEIRNLIQFVKDRPGHDFRYAINCEKIKSELGWKRNFNFDEALKLTIDWYLK